MSTRDEREAAMEWKVGVWDPWMKELEGEQPTSEEQEEMDEWNSLEGVIDFIKQAFDDLAPNPDCQQFGDGHFGQLMFFDGLNQKGDELKAFELTRSIRERKPILVFCHCGTQKVLIPEKDFDTDGW